MPSIGMSPPIADVTQRLEVLPRSDRRHAVIAHDQLVALAALIQSVKETE